VVGRSNNRVSQRNEFMNAEQTRLKENNGWKKWGPYVSDRQWGTVREDYSANGDAWNYITHDMARSKAYRWSEEGIAGVCDDQQHLCFAIALWNKRDPIIKERYFGLSNPEGNHGEDVKELYYYLDSTPTHSYMKMLYKYPQQEYPYAWLLDENKRRSRNEREFEIIDTGIFNEDKYFDVFVEYAKSEKDDILIKITVHNRGDEDAALNVLPTVWFRNTWAWGHDDYKPGMSEESQGVIDIFHRETGQLWLKADGDPALLFCENETNTQRLHNYDDGKVYCKDGINDFIVHQSPTVNPKKTGTKAAVNYDVTVPAKQSLTFRLRLTANPKKNFSDFDKIFKARQAEADEFYDNVQHHPPGSDHAMIHRQAFAGMLWSKQFYHYDIHKWLEGDPAMPKPPAERLNGRNSKWQHLNTRDIISMPDKWEYPWFAAWDLSFHCLAIAKVDMDFAKKQLLLLTRDWYMHPNGQLPAYEWDFGDVNPPVLAMAAVDVRVRLVAEAGIERLAAKGRAMTELTAALGEAWLAPHGVALASPRDPARRGSHVTFAHPQAWQLTQALIDRGVVPDFRTPDRVRLGPAPLYTRFVDVWDAMDRFRAVLEEGAQDRYSAARARVT